MADARYEPNRAGWAKVLLSPEILAACVAEAERGKAHAISISPRSTQEQREFFEDRYNRPSTTPRYAESFDVYESIAPDFKDGPRVSALLVNDAPHSPAVEHGNRATPRPHRVVQRTAAFLGNE